ncbi:hypothetical protein [Halorussus amylolyticus]|uniref:hypothetical protein n=1 Tax=Halorussus amylolyticus TaxID=1126242 RepID=UPI00192F63B7|nr:hypothetical protein [Halorussus amylolyticus]
MTTAGRLSGLPPLGAQQRYGRVGVPPAGKPEYRRWIPALSTLDTPVEQYYFTILRPKDIPLDAPELAVARRVHAKTDLDHFGIGFENYDRLINSSVGTVIEANFDRESVLQTIADTGYERSAEYRGYEVFARSDVPRHVAFGNDVVVWTNEYRHDAPNLEALIDAGKGAVLGTTKRTPPLSDSHRSQGDSTLILPIRWFTISTRRTGYPHGRRSKQR